MAKGKAKNPAKPGNKGKGVFQGPWKQGKGIATAGRDISWAIGHTKKKK